MRLIWLVIVNIYTKLGGIGHFYKCDISNSESISEAI